ncbi:MAG TPA: hypothetical protein VFR90_10650 [Methylibium sp.]|uniref:hypothetical protein n=1 Tax=Methylibium sp. TaxID=2067992 RepID=UPI002DBF48C5|nr:hypothetical protein [Methylibium sp.]HEU4459572.1 hypothetical protein [Methylibium sp.]
MSVNTNYSSRYGGYDNSYPSYRNQPSPQNQGMQNWGDFKTVPNELVNVIRTQAELIQSMKFVLGIVLKALNNGDMGALSGMAQKFLGGFDNMAPPFLGEPQNGGVPGQNYGPSYPGPSYPGPNFNGSNTQGPSYPGSNYNGFTPPGDPFANPQQGGMPWFNPGNFNMPNFGFPNFNAGYTPPMNSGRPQVMNDDRALSVIYNAFDSLKTPGAQNLTKADLERAAQNPNLNPEIREAARYLLENPSMLRALDTARQDNAGLPGRVDNEYDRGDFLVTMNRDKLTAGDRAALQVLKANARELFANGGTMSPADLQRIADTGEIRPGVAASPELREAAGRLVKNKDLMDRLDSAGSLYGGAAGPNMNGVFSEGDIDRLLGSPLSTSGSANPANPKSPREAVGIVMSNFLALFPDGVMNRGKIDEKLKDPNLKDPQRAALQMLLDTPGLLDKLDKGRGDKPDGQIQMSGLTNFLGNTVANEPERVNLQGLAKNWNAIVGQGQPFDMTKIGEYITKADQMGNKEAGDALRFLQRNPALMDSLDVNLGAGYNGKWDTPDKKFSLEQVQQLLNAR